MFVSVTEWKSADQKGLASAINKAGYFREEAISRASALSRQWQEGLVQVVASSSQTVEAVERFAKGFEGFDKTSDSDDLHLPFTAASISSSSCSGTE